MLHLRHAFKKLTVHSLIDSVEDLDIVMSMYNLLEQSQNYSMTSESLWNYYRDEIDDVGDNVSDGTSGTQPPRPPQPAVPTLNVEVIIPLIYLCNFWRFLDYHRENVKQNLIYHGQKTMY